MMAPRASSDEEESDVTRHTKDFFLHTKDIFCVAPVAMDSGNRQ